MVEGGVGQNVLLQGESGAKGKGLERWVWGISRWRAAFPTVGKGTSDTAAARDPSGFAPRLRRGVMSGRDDR